jgi:hypothetical protein
MKSSMPIDLKSKWVAALRSGDYTQGKGQLHNTENNSFCCLGVLQMVADGKCEKHGIVTSLPWVKNHNINFRHAAWPESVTDVPSVVWNDQVVSLWELNDFVEASFAQIADVIDEQIEGV